MTLIYGILNFANIAHGDYMTLGAYAALFIIDSLLPKIGVEGEGLGPFTFGYPLLIALPIAAAVIAAAAIALDVVVYRRLRNRDMNAVVVSMASLGVAIALRGLVQLIWGGDVQRLPRETRQVFHLPMDVRIPPDAIFIAIVAVILVVALYLVLSRSKMGKAMRAVKGGGKTYHWVSLFRINVRPSVQHKCHLVRLPWYQMLTSWAQPEVVALVGPQSPGISSRWPG